MLANPQYLVHFDPTCRLYADVDAFKAFRIKAIIYYIKDDDPYTITNYNNNFKALLAIATKLTYLKKFSIKLIMFLSRKLLLAKHRY